MKVWSNQHMKVYNDFQVEKAVVHPGEQTQFPPVPEKKLGVLSKET